MEGGGSQRWEEEESGNGHDGLLRDDLDRAFDLDHLVRDMLIQIDTKHLRQACW